MARLPPLRSRGGQVESPGDSVLKPAKTALSEAGSALGRARLLPSRLFRAESAPWPHACLAFNYGFHSLRRCLIESAHR
jgi:hypothetical protein